MGVRGETERAGGGSRSSITACRRSVAGQLSDERVEEVCDVEEGVIVEL